MSTLPVVSLNIERDKSFRNFRGPTRQFNHTNFVYGANGHGKTTLARNIKLSALNVLNEEQVKHFSKKYIDDAVVIKDSSALNGIEGSFGNEARDQEERLRKLESKSEEIDKKLSETRDSIKKNCENTADLIKKTIDSKKGRLRINNHSSNEYGDGYLNVYPKVIDNLQSSNFEEAKRYADIETIRGASGDRDYEALLNDAEKLKVNEEDISENLAERLERIFKESYSDTIPSEEVVSWIEHGLKFHSSDDEDSCKFCGNTIDYSELKERFQKFQTDTKTADSKFLRNLLEQLESIKNNLQSLREDESYRNTIQDENLINELFGDKGAEGAVSKNISFVKHLINTTEAKLQEMTKSDSLPCTQEEINDIQTPILEINHHLEDVVISGLKTQENKQDAIVKGSIALSVKENDLYISNKKEYDKLLDAESKYGDELETIKEEIIDIKNNTSSIAGFISSANAFLNDLNVHFKLQPIESGRKCKILTKNGEELTTNDISEGEINLLALLWFYHELFTDEGDNGEINENVKLIIIDDPLTSLDDSNQFYILQIIKYMCEKSNNAQIFIFTHSWSHYSDLCYRKTGDDGFMKYRLHKKHNNSTLSYDTGSQDTPYQVLFKAVNDFANSNNDDDQYITMPNNMRRLIEEFSKFYRNISATSAKSDKEKIAKVLTGMELSALTRAKRTKFDLLIDTCNILSHKVSKAPNPDDVHNSAKNLMQMFRESHGQHFHAMIGDN